MRIFLNDVLKQRNMSVRFKLQQKKGEDLRHFSLIFFPSNDIYIHTSYNSYFKSMLETKIESIWI